jgi:hypothetical protein
MASESDTTEPSSYHVPPRPFNKGARGHPKLSTKGVRNLGGRENPLGKDILAMEGPIW